MLYDYFLIITIQGQQKKGLLAWCPWSNYILEAPGRRVLFKVWCPWFNYFLGAPGRRVYQLGAPGLNIVKGHQEERFISLVPLV